MAADEHESAVAAWLDSPETQRELQILGDRFPDWTEQQRIQLVMSMEILVSLDLYGDRDADINIEINNVKPEDLPDAEDDDPWQTGWKPSQN